MGGGRGIHEDLIRKLEGIMWAGRKNNNYVITCLDHIQNIMGQCLILYNPVIMMTL